MTTLSVLDEQILEIIEGFEKLEEGDVMAEGAKVGIIFVLNALGINIEGINMTQEDSNEG